jgi:TRAP-type uncharacterized transport system fused permease subunit
MTETPAKRFVVVRARQVLVAFLFTFIAARILVYLIMARKVPDLYLHMGGNHVHHLNYGIFLLSFIGGFLIFVQPRGKDLSVACFVYGIGLALTFDEFGMWYHLSATYWQRASFDAVVVIAALLLLIAAAPQIKRFRPRHWTTAIVMAASLALFAYLLHNSLKYARVHVGPRLHQLDDIGPQ